MKLALVGEAWGRHEEVERRPFIGPAGLILNSMLRDAGISRAECFVTNVFNLRPKPTDDIANLCGNKKDVTHTLPPLAQGKYIRDEYLGELDRLRGELERCSPNVVVALGGTAAWALLGDGSIGRIRGAVAASGWGHKVLPTYHPAAVMRDWSLRPITVLDLRKALRESEFPEIRRPAREIWIEPTLADIASFYNRFIESARELSIDVETIGEQISCFGVAPRPDLALVIPFIDNRRGGSYWPSLEEELCAWRWVRKVCAHPAAKVGQNILYDVNRLWRSYGIPLLHVEDDTMLLHHALQPESPKGLGFLGSVYTNEASWKLLNRKTTTLKRED